MRGTWHHRRDDSTRFALRARQAGVPVRLEVWDEMIHCWPANVDALPEARQAVERIGAFVRTTAGGTES